MALKNLSNKFYNEAIASSEQERLATLQLIRTNNIGPITFLKLIQKYQKPSVALIETGQILKAKGKELRPLADIESELKTVEKYGAKIITIFDAQYPALLAEIDDPPIAITVKGNISRLTDNNVAIVGARYASANAISLTYKMCKELAALGPTIISGLARGIDTAAHKGALEAKIDHLPTVAVIAGGIDNIYPPENERLFESIAEKGVIISENEFGTVPKAEHFPRRNRIISGLSQVICVMEAALKSGSLITARLATEQNRDVACVPGFPLDPRSEGTNLLIKKGAQLITSANDIMELMNDFNGGKQNISFKESDEEFYDVDEVKDETLDLLSVISTSPTAIDDIIIQHGVSASYLNSKLMEYEITGKIIRHAGNKVSKVA